MMDCETCTHCGKEQPTVEKRYSFGIYAGELCDECAYTGFRDHCGLVIGADGKYEEGGEQGAVEDLDEFEAGGYYAIYGDDDY